MHDWEIDQYIEALVTGGDDPELDLLLGCFAPETGARQGGTISLRLSRIKPAPQMIELFEKGRKLADQPVSAELIEALLARAAARGGPSCDPTSATYDPQHRCDATRRRSAELNAISSNVDVVPLSTGQTLGAVVEGA